MSELDPQFNLEDISFSAEDDVHNREPFNSEPEPNEPAQGETAQGQQSEEQKALAEINTMFGEGWAPETGIDASIETFYDPAVRDTYTLNPNGESEYAKNSIYTSQGIQEKFVSDLERDGVSIEKFVDEKTNTEYAFMAHLGANNKIEYFTFIRELEITERERAQNKEPQTAGDENIPRLSSSTPPSEIPDTPSEQEPIVFYLDDFFKTETAHIAINNDLKEFDFQTFFGIPITATTPVKTPVKAMLARKQEKKTFYKSEEFLGITLVMGKTETPQKKLLGTATSLQQKEANSIPFTLEGLLIGNQETNIHTAQSGIITETVTYKQPAIEISTTVPKLAEPNDILTPIALKESAEITPIEEQDIHRNDIFKEALYSKSTERQHSTDSNQNSTIDPGSNRSVVIKNLSIGAMKSVYSLIDDGPNTSQAPTEPEGSGPSGLAQNFLRDEIPTALWGTSGEIQKLTTFHESKPQAATSEKSNLQVETRKNRDPFISEVITKEEPPPYTLEHTTAYTRESFSKEKGDTVSLKEHPEEQLQKTLFTKASKNNITQTEVPTPLTETSSIIKSLDILTRQPSKNIVNATKADAVKVATVPRQASRTPSAPWSPSSGRINRSLVKKTTLYAPLGGEQIAQARERVVSIESKRAVSLAVESIKVEGVQLLGTRRLEQVKRQERPEQQRRTSVAPNIIQKPAASLEAPIRRNPQTKNIQGPQAISQIQSIKTISQRPLGFIPDEVIEETSESSIIDLIDTLRQAA